jgi:hypothetical protein
MTLMLLSEAWGKMIHKKTRSKKSHDTVPLNCLLRKFLKEPYLILFGRNFGNLAMLLGL